MLLSCTGFSANDIPLPPRLPKLVLLDRDGVINQDVGSPGVLQTSQLELTEGAATAIGDLRRAGCHIAIVTNQSCVGKGLITETQLQNIHIKLNHILMEQDTDAKVDLENILFCTSVKNKSKKPADDDERMKPNPGMIVEACNLFSVEPRDCVLIGDTIRDLQAAMRGSIPTRILVETGYGRSIMKGRPCNRESCVELIDNNEYFERDILTEEGESENVSNPLPFYYTQSLRFAADWLLSTTHHPF